MSEFITVGHLPDRKNIRLQKDWDKDFSWYILMKTVDIQSLKSSETIMLNDKEVGWILEFKDIEVDCLKFIDITTGAIVILDPCNDLTRNTLSIYSIEHYDLRAPACEFMAHKIKWYDIQDMVFDTNFFKEGHAYKIKITDTLNSYWVHSLLKTITYDYLEFTYINPHSSLVSSYTVSVNKYKNNKNKDWFIALDPDDKWSDELENKNE